MASNISIRNTLMVATVIFLSLTACDNKKREDDKMQTIDWKNEQAKTVQKASGESVETRFLLDCRGKVNRHTHYYYSVFTSSDVRGSLDKALAKNLKMQEELVDADMLEKTDKEEERLGRPLTDKDKESLRKIVIGELVKNHDQLKDKDVAVVKGRFQINRFESVAGSEDELIKILELPIYIAVRQSPISRLIEVRLSPDSVEFIKEFKLGNGNLKEAKSGKVIFSVEELEKIRINRSKVDWPSLEIGQNIECKD